MKKIMRIEERNRQQVYRMLNELSKRKPVDSSDVEVFDLYIQEFEQVVNRMFSANIFFKGMDYACSRYKHIVKVEYNRFCLLAIQKIPEDTLQNQLLFRIRKKRNQLLKAAPTASKTVHGFELFYGLTGGFRKKYKTDRKAIEQMYDELNIASAQPFYNIYYLGQRIARFITYLRKHLLWQLRTCIRD